MRSSKKHFLVIACLLLSLVSTAQENETSAYIIQLNGDTLNGFIDYRDWEKDPSQVAFKVNQADSYTRYTPSDIAGYGVENEVYKSARIETEVSSDDVTTLSDDPNVITLEATVFLQELIRGDKGLYYYINQAGKYQFYINNTGTYELLIYKRYYKKVNDEYEIFINKRYIGQLLNHLQDCPEIAKDIIRIKYTSTDLKDIFNKYYSCKGLEFEFKRKGKKLQVQFGVSSGVSVTNLDFNKIGKSIEISLGKDNLLFFKDFNPTNYVGITPGIFFDIIWPYGERKWSLSNELTYNTYKSSDIVDNKGYGTRFDISLNQSNLRVNNLIRCTLPIKDFSIILNIGIANTIMSENKDRTYRMDITTNEVLEQINAFSNITGSSAFLFGIGTSYKNFSLEYRAERFRNKTGETYLEKRLHTNHIFLGYKIFSSQKR